MACIAEMPQASDCRESAGITAVEKANSSPPASPEPTAPTTVRRAENGIGNHHRKFHQSIDAGRLIGVHGWGL